MLTIKNHVLLFEGEPVHYVQTPNMKTSDFDPAGIVVHDTAGRLGRFSSVNWMKQKKAKAAAHFCIERDGFITQMAKLNHQTWHAGKSSYKGRKWCNKFTFGIEIVNPGKMQNAGGGSGLAWFGKTFDKAQYGLREIRTEEHGNGIWMPYTREQIDSVTGLCRALVEAYGCTYIVPHWQISPGRKVDTNPLFPLDSLRGNVFGRGDEEQPDDDGFDATVVVASNMRRWPSYADNVIEVVPRNARVDVLRSGSFPSGTNGNHEQWHLCDTGSNEGWINARLIDLD